MRCRFAGYIGGIYRESLLQDTHCWVVSIIVVSLSARAEDTVTWAVCSILVDTAFAGASTSVPVSFLMFILQNVTFEMYHLLTLYAQL